jgi:hypothetical protein
MPFLRRLFGSKQVPHWAGFLSLDEYRRFQLVFEEELKKKAPDASLNWEDCSWRRASNPDQVYGLANIAQMCKTNEGDWSALCATYIGKLLLPQQGMAETFEEAQSHLRVRLFPTDMQGQDLLVTTPKSSEFITALVYDTPTSAASVNQTKLEEWGATADQAFEIAFENVWKKENAGFHELDLEGRCTVLALEGESLYTASHLLMLDRHFPEETPHGALVTAPNRHFLIYYPIRDISVTNALGTLAPLAQVMYEAGPGSISPKLFWRRHGELRPLDIKMARGQLNFNVSPDFHEMLESLV